MSLARAVLTRNTNTTPNKLVGPFNRGERTSPTTSPPSPSIQSPITQAIERRHHHVDWDAMVQQAQQDKNEDDQQDSMTAIDVDDVTLRKAHLEALLGLRDAESIEEEVSTFDEPSGMTKVEILRFLVSCLDSTDHDIALKTENYVNSCVTLLLRESLHEDFEEAGQDGGESGRVTPPPARTPTPPPAIGDLESVKPTTATNGHAHANGHLRVEVPNGSAICSGVVTTEGLNLYQQRYVEECARVSVVKGGWRSELTAGLEGGQEKKVLQPNRSLLFKLGHIDENAALDLSDNMLGAAGVIPLLRILHDAKFITALDLSDNDLQDSSIPELKTLLSANTNITKLNLSNNQRLAATAGKDLVELLRQCPHVVALELRNTSIPKHCLQNIGTLVQSNSDRLHAERRQVQSLEVSEVPQSSSGKVMLSAPADVSPTQLYSTLRHY